MKVTKYATTKYVVAFVAGAVLGTLYDWIHVAFRVLEYNSPDFLGQSRWVPLEFGGGAAVCLFVIQRLKLYIELPPVNYRRTLLDGALLAVGYLCTGIFVGQTFITFIALCIVALYAVFIPRNQLERIGQVSLPVVGPLCEIFFSKIGLFHYLHVPLIPYWLPVLWILAAGFFMNACLIFIDQDK